MLKGKGLSKAKKERRIWPMVACSGLQSVISEDGNAIQGTCVWQRGWTFNVQPVDTKLFFFFLFLPILQS